MANSKDQTHQTNGKQLSVQVNHLTLIHERIRKLKLKHFLLNKRITIMFQKIESLKNEIEQTQHIKLK